MNLLLMHLDSAATIWWAAIVRSFLQGSIALIIAGVLCLLPFRASIKSWIWRLAYLKVLLVFFVSASIALPLLPSRKIERPMAAPAAASFAGPIAISRQLPASVPVIASKAVSKPMPARLYFKPEGVLFLFWMAGTLVMLMRLLLGLHSVKKLRRGSSIVAEQGLQERLISLAKLLSARPPALRISNIISTPLLVGILRPAIILPERLLGSEREKLEIVLAHELAHLKRRDLAWNWLAALAKIFFWFNPLIWLSLREWRLVQEIACDELAIQATSARPAQYGSVLLDFATHLSSAGRPQLISAGIVETKKSLERRLKAMKKIGGNKRGTLASLLVLLCLGVGMIPWRIVAQKASDETPEKPKTSEPNNDPNRKERELYNREIDLAKIQLDDYQRQYKNGRVDSSTLLQQQRDIEKLNRELAWLDNDREAYRKSLQDELKLVDQLFADQKKRIDNGMDTQNSILKIKREQLRIERELAALENRSPADPFARRPEEKVHAVREKEVELTTTYVPQRREEAALLRQIDEAQKPPKATSGDGSNQVVTVTGLMQDRGLRILLEELEKKEDQLAAAGDDKGQIESLQRQVATLKMRIEQEKADSTSMVYPRSSSHPRTTIVSPRAGIVRRVHVKEGAHVRAGEPLVELDNREAAAKLETAQAEREVIMANVQIQEAQLGEAEQEYKRKNELLQQKLISPAELPNIEKAGIQVRRAKAEVAVADRKVQEAKLEADMYTIRAPRDGAVVRLYVHEGGAVTSPLLQGVLLFAPGSSKLESGK
jgi:beta-lactamase regulating signal transducer with metallopeptidase domain/biotin carboxyl carrier protein